MNTEEITVIKDLVNFILTAQDYITTEKDVKHLAKFLNSLFKEMEGKILVPIEPTEEIITDGLKTLVAGLNNYSYLSIVREIYKAMIKQREE